MGDKGPQRARMGGGAVVTYSGAGGGEVVTSSGAGGWVTCSRCNVLVSRYRRNDRNAIRESETFSV